MKPAEPVMRRVGLFCDIFFAFFLAAGFPATDAFADAFVFAVEGGGAPSGARRPFIAVMSAHALMDIVQQGLVVGLQGHVFMDIIPPTPRLNYH